MAQGVRAELSPGVTAGIPDLSSDNHEEASTQPCRHTDRAVQVHMILCSKEIFQSDVTFKTHLPFSFRHIINIRLQQH